MHVAVVCDEVVNVIVLVEELETDTAKEMPVEQISAVSVSHSSGFDVGVYVGKRSDPILHQVTVNANILMGASEEKYCLGSTYVIFGNGGSGVRIVTPGGNLISPGGGGPLPFLN